MYPSGYKEDKIYSLKPTDGSGDLTFTRASTATRVNADGLIEGVRTNLILQSNTFDTTWTNTSTTLTSGQSGYDGTTNAWLLTKPATSFARIQQTFSSTSGLKTFSIYLKAGTLSWCRLFAASAPSPNIYVNLSNGSLGSQYDNISATSTDVGAGWYRVSLTFDASITEIRIYPADANDSVSGISGNIYIQDAQLEASVQATEYIPTTTTAVSVGMLANVPRIDYTGGGCGKLLLEGQRTNLVIYSEQFDNWSFIGATANPNVSASPDGYQSADEIIGDGSSNNVRTYIGLSTSAGVNTFSVFLKSGNTNFAYIEFSGFGGITGTTAAYFDLANGTTPTSGANIEDYGDGWYRCSISATIDASDTSGNVSFRATPNTVASSFPTAGDADGKYVLAWGAQLELGSYPTSYIPTLGTAVTRVADGASKSGISSLINSEEGVLYVEGSVLDFATTNSWISISEDANYNNNQFNLRFVENSNLIQVVSRADGLGQDVVLNYALTDKTALNKIAVKYKLNDWALWVNGVEVDTETSSIPFTANSLDVLDFNRGNNSNYFYGNVQNLMVFPSALSDAELETLTTL